MVPMRTIVAPSSTATVKSCVVPIDSRGRSWRRASSHSAANWGRLSSAVSVIGRTVLRPVSGETIGWVGGHVLDGGAPCALVGSPTGSGGGGADLLTHAQRVGPHPLRRQRLVHVRHTSPACRPVTPPSRRWEKNRAGSAHM